MGVFALDVPGAERDNATTPNCDDTPGSHISRRDPAGGVPRNDIDECADELDVLGYDLERALHWSRMRGRHLRAGGSVRWFADGTFVLEPGVAGIGRVITHSGEA